MTITKLDREKLALIEKAILAQLNETLGKDMGLGFRFTGGRFTDLSVSLKLEVSVSAGDGRVVDMDRVNFEKYAVMFGLKSEWLDCTFNSNGRTMKVVGLNPKRRKNAVLIVDVTTGKKFVTSPFALQMAVKTNGKESL